MLWRNARFPGPLPPSAPVRRPAQPLTEGQRLLADINAFLRRHPHISRTGFGLEACNNDAIIKRLENGLSPRQVTIDRVRRYMETIEG
jgi:hypothetical protein